MSVTVTAKVRVNWVGNGQVHMAPVYSTDHHSENYKFFKATPWGVVNLGILNEDTLKYFENGEEYTVEFKKVEKLNTNG